jgi:phosphonate transport system substrate-binding protein
VGLFLCESRQNDASCFVHYVFFAANPVDLVHGRQTPENELIFQGDCANRLILVPVLAENLELEFRREKRKNMRFGKTVIKLLFSLAILNQSVQADDKSYSFGVLNQRSITLTAQYWNPILKYLGDKSGVRLQLKMGKTAPETSAMIGSSEFDFVYSNTIFTPANDPVGYRVIARPVESTIQGQVVTLSDSPIHTLKDLEGKEVGFPSLAGFVGYAVPMNAFLHAGIRVKPVFAGNPEGIIGQLKAGRVIAAGVNSRVMRDFSRRDGLKYRVLWSSEEYLNLPISAHPSVPQEKAKAVREALLGMAKEPAGLKILEASAALIKQGPPYGFVPAENREYENYRMFYKTTLVKGL